MSWKGECTINFSSWHKGSLLFLDIAREIKCRSALAVEPFIFIFSIIRQISLWPKIWHKEGKVGVKRIEVKQPDFKMEFSNLTLQNLECLLE